MKKFTIYLSLVLASFATRAEKCLGDPSGWTNCVGMHTLPDGQIYVGEFKDGKLHGQGKIILQDGNTYMGDFKNHKPNGQGTFTFLDGRKFVGEFKDGTVNGQGTLLDRSGGIVFSGQWVDGKPTVKASVPENSKGAGPCLGDLATSVWTNCVGAHTFPDGIKYVGEWRDNKRHGQGTSNHPSGAKYVGEFRDDKRNGLGTETLPSSGKYVGEFRDNVYNGQGTFSLPSGAKYVGEFKDGNMHGPGTETYPDGEKYVGELRDNKRNGLGTATYANGAKYVGQHKDGMRNGQGTYTLDGDVYVGEFKDDIMHGRGTQTLTNGTKYVGEFKGGKKHGQGTYTLPDGEKLQGEWREDMLNGQGVHTFADGTKYGGEFRNSGFHGQGTLLDRSGGIVFSGQWVDGKPTVKASVPENSKGEESYPYLAIISCGMPSGHINIVACFGGGASRNTPTALVIGRGAIEKMYKTNTIGTAGREQSDGLKIDLPNEFHIKAQNSNRTLILEVKIIEKKTGKVVFQRQAAQYGVIDVSN